MPTVSTVKSALILVGLIAVGTVVGIKLNEQLNKAKSAPLVAKAS